MKEENKIKLKMGLNKIFLNFLRLIPNKSQLIKFIIEVSLIDQDIVFGPS